jgi:hypothetical protein
MEARMDSVENDSKSVKFKSTAANMDHEMEIKGKRPL